MVNTTISDPETATDYEPIRASIAAKFTNPLDLPKEIFSDPAVYHEELERIFYGPYWHPVAHRAELSEINSFKTTWLGEIPILISRGADDRIRAFVNSCTHRGTLLEQREVGVATEFQCPYHRWLFNSGGEFCGAPGEREFRSDFDRKDYGLPELRVEEIAGLIFVTRHPDTPLLETFLGECADPVRDCMIDDGDLTLLGYQKVVYKTNWKTYFDNDFYHAPLLHTGFRILGWQGGKGDVRITQPVGHFSVGYQSTPYVDNGYLADPSVVQFRGTDDRARVVALRPVTVMTKHVDTINVRFARPRGVDRTEVSYAFFGHASDTPEYREHRVRQASNLLGPSGFITIEDAAVFNRQQMTADDRTLARFVKGVDGRPEDATQNDEIGNTVGWAYYRKVMGFDH
ncbi:aromatic ring-hydroxylating dioxygenase subunit alpha (plasmid) [Prescottella equi]|uniref:aromatic ring-hydroxylating oxygenase subunit alpha n=1 Tax=Rhodococcus hoagii TaxID=43767 RepID=UPI001319258A|nr:aromatic ring-hydroxylating dioxygenase subunit alpha [Prescottella equi]QGP74839.1 3-phenylpropionate dioxygenase alpha subunit [Rhodococcus sp. (in: high G+C Gram-positive bacteria)]WJJ14354.1 aromatic ring-hydroxylating dioxygenase subunit alpha [Prescottella equi]